MTAKVQTKQDVLDALRANRGRLRALGVERVGVFGSFCHDAAGPGSDVDILVEFAPEKKTFLNWSGTWDLAEEVFGRQVDLVTPESLSRHCGPKVLAEAEYVSTAG